MSQPLARAFVEWVLAQKVEDYLVQRREDGRIAWWASWLRRLGSNYSAFTKTASPSRSTSVMSITLPCTALILSGKACPLSTTALR